MLNSFLILIAATVFAYASQLQTERCAAHGKVYRAHEDPGYLALVIMFVLYAGFRTDYNDTMNYAGIFKDAPNIVTYFAEMEEFNILANPLYYIFQSIIKTFTDNWRWLILLSSVYVQLIFIRFIKRYSTNFVLSMFIYVCMGTFSLSMSAIKQTMAMATLCLAIPFLEKKKWVPFYSLVFIAMLFHTYALAFAVLPLFMLKPWRKFTYIFVILVVVLLMNFETVITDFLDQADEMGKTIAEYEVFDEYTVNIMRVAVYAVIPLLTLVLQRWLFHDSVPIENLLVHMSIISLAFMSMGTQSGANMFGRMANYFELGTICCLPWVIEKAFEERTARYVTVTAAVCFFGFYSYGALLG